MAMMRKRAAQILFFLLLAWPSLHAVTSQSFGFSTWRFFGWGMYATPYPGSLAVLQVILVKGEAVSDYQSLYEELGRSGERAPNRECLGVFVKQDKQPLRPESAAKLCGNDVIEDDLAYVWHFGSKRHLLHIADRVARRAGMVPDAQILVFIVHQQVDLRRARAYTNADLFEATGGKIRFLQSFRDREWNNKCALTIFR